MNAPIIALTAAVPNALFITRLFNQICVSADLKKRFKSEQCYQIFREIVFAKFEEQFKNSGKKPAIGIKAN
uniref:Uncharacterized protein n=1 Tax=Parascaris univalens TaxID=6257 RepID=A0A914ZMG3_PARUN